MRHVYDRELLEQTAYERWVKRGKPAGSPSVGWASAQARVAREQDTTATVWLANRARMKKRQALERSSWLDEE